MADVRECGHHCSAKESCAHVCCKRHVGGNLLELDKLMDNIRSDPPPEVYPYAEIPCLSATIKRNSKQLGLRWLVDTTLPISVALPPHMAEYLSSFCDHLSPLYSLPGILSVGIVDFQVEITVKENCQPTIGWPLLKQFKGILFDFQSKQTTFYFNQSKHELPYLKYPQLLKAPAHFIPFPQLLFSPLALPPNGKIKATLATCDDKSPAVVVHALATNPIYLGERKIVANRECNAGLKFLSCTFSKLLLTPNNISVEMLDSA